MKIKILSLLLILAVSLTSCSREDDAPSEPTQSTTGLIGTWDLDFYVEGGTLVEEIVCSEQVTYVFSKDSRYTKTTYAGEGATSCKLAVIVNGTWANLSDNQYALTPNGSETEENLNITFQDSFTKFTIVYSGTYTEVYSKQ